MGYVCDPHQRWAYEGWCDDPEPLTCGDCEHYWPAPFPSEDFGLCILRTEVGRERTRLAWMFGDDGACEEFSE